MRKALFVILLLCMVSPAAFAADSFYFRFTGGLAVASFDSKIQFADDNSFEDMTVGGGTYFSVGVEVERLIVSYINQIYIGIPDKINGTETDDLSLVINVDSVDASIKIFDKDLKNMFNFIVGVGRGIGKASYDVGTSEAAQYISEFHYQMTAYYALFDSLTINLGYMSQSFAFVEQPAFSNSLYSASATFKF